MRTYVIKEKKKPPVAVAQKSEAKVSGAVDSGAVDRSEIRAILRADTDREKKETEVKPRIDQDKTPDDSEV